MHTPTLEPVRPKPISHRRTACRGCGGGDLELVISLGRIPLVNTFLRKPEDGAREQRYPLDVYVCPSCTLVQLLEVVDPEVLFRDYIYVSGVSETMAAHNAAYARTVVDLLDLGADDLVVEIASNDGSFLKCFQQLGVRALGVEPAANLARLAEAAGVETVNRFFNADLTPELVRSHGPAKAIVANNVLAHVDGTLDFLRGCRDLLHPDGLLVVEVPYLRDMVDKLEYDTIYHEHLCYFSTTALARLCEAAGLSIVRVNRVPVHGGSLRVYAGRVERHARHGAEIFALMEEEAHWGVAGPQRYQRFADGVRENRAALRKLLRSLNDSGKSVAGYGAPAKGNVLLNYCGI